MPTTVQIVGKNMMDEELVQIMKVAEDILGEEQ
jgi:Asp-tRNA(Asn)/Glu-tRNA(Gln) amidotransferase A subunit family amidase